MFFVTSSLAGEDKKACTRRWKSAHTSASVGSCSLRVSFGGTDEGGLEVEADADTSASPWRGSGVKDPLATGAFGGSDVSLDMFGK